MDDSPVTKEEIMENFVVTKMYGDPGGWPRETTALCKIVCTDGEGNEPVFYKVFKNTDDKTHAEIHLIKYLKSDAIVTQATKINIKIYQNYSPCSACAAKITGYIEEVKSKKRKIEMTIAFANFYNTHSHSGNTPEEADENKEGLKGLKEGGVQLQLIGHGEHDIKWKDLLDMDQFFYDPALQKANGGKRKKREVQDRKLYEELGLNQDGVGEVTSQVRRSLSVTDTQE